MKNGAGIIAGLLLICGTALPESPGPAFEVTSIKPRKTVDLFEPGLVQKMNFGCSPGGRFVSTRYLLIKTVSWAWDVSESEVAGMPAWTGAQSPDAYFDIEATAGAPISTEQCRLMAQAMLADRFKVAAHRETRLISVDTLVQRQGEIKLKQVTEADRSKPDSGVILNGRMMPAAHEGGEKVRGLTMAQLADLLSYTAEKIDGRRVVDETGLQGRYEIHLDFDQFPGRIWQRDKPDLFTAVQQLGLKLENRKRSFEIIVIDHMEKPSEN
jgi:uncharacterized protein (TIGR03435 family)